VAPPPPLDAVGTAGSVVHAATTVAAQQARAARARGEETTSAANLERAHRSILVAFPIGPSE
jgi:hypothetical protein